MANSDTASTYRHSVTLFADAFVNSAGCVLFVPPHTETGRPTQLCLLHHLPSNQVMLPKGRKDQNEELLAAAVRETFEETGVRCALLPVTMDTCAPAPSSTGASQKERARRVKECTEPFAMTIRQMSGRTKFVWWFVGRAILLKDGSGLPEAYEGTQMANEDFKTFLYGLDINVHHETELDAAVAALTFEDDRDAAKQAIRLVCNTYPEWFPKTAYEAKESNEGDGFVHEDE